MAPEGITTTAPEPADAASRIHMTWSIAAGILAGVVYTLSPLTVWAAAGASAVIWLAGRDLSVRERTWLRALLVTALALRVAAVGTLFLTSPHDDQHAPALFGDEAYTQARAMRMRNIALDVPVQKIDYVLAFDEYGRNSYIDLLAVIYVVFGPAPYGARLVNSVVFVAGAALLFRIGRRAYGPVAGFGSLVILLFLPTLFMWSIALLKEPLYFGLMAAIVGGTVVVLRAGPVVRRAGALAATVAGAWLVGGLRAGAGSLVAASALLAVALLIATRTAVRVAVLAVVTLVASAALVQYPPVQQRLLAAVQRAASVHAGHVFTVGHAYKLLDDTSYMKPRGPGDVTVSEAEAARFIVRAIASFVLVPLPWQIVTRAELVLLPEHLLWYALVALALAGLAEAYRRDAVVTSVLLAQALTAAAAVAFTNGNVGTLVRFRGLVTPYIASIALVGLCAVTAAIVMRPPMTSADAEPQP